jgi:hypothetical protein
MLALENLVLIWDSPKPQQKLSMSKAYLVKISDHSQAFADSGIDFRIVVEIPDQVLSGRPSDPIERTRQTISGGRLDPIERAKQVARDAVNERWQKVSPGSPPVALHYFAVEELPGDLTTSPTPGFKPYRSADNERGWIVHGPHALVITPEYV